MSKNKNLSDQEILNIWKDINFPASFRGAKTFQAVLKTDLNINVSEKRLYDILKTEPLFLIHQIKSKKFLRRKYITHNYGELCQADVAFMFPDSNIDAKAFLLLIDVYSFKIFVEVLKNKESETIADALFKIFKKFGAPIYQLQTDAGTEFKGKPCQQLLKKYHVLYRTKRPPLKANVAEAAILRVKRKLYMYLRSHLSQHWTNAIQQVVEALNSIPLKRLGYLTPNSIKSELDSVLVDESLKKHNLPIQSEPTYQEQKRNAETYLKNVQSDKKLIKSGDYVYLTFYNDVFFKSFDTQENTFKAHSF